VTLDGRNGMYDVKYSGKADRAEMKVGRGGNSERCNDSMHFVNMVLLVSRREVE
jgi:hypothetical protein